MFIIPTKDKKNICPICNGEIFKCSRVLNIKKKTRLDWISDSTFELSELDEVDSYLSTCFNCFHSILLPFYEVSKIYKNNLGLETRKKAYQNYFPNRIYGGDESFTDFDLFKKASREFNRFQKNISLVSKLFKSHKSTSYEEFSILDYGGGDGYISSIFSNLFSTLLNKKVDYFIYDFNQWKNSKGEIFDKDNNNKKFQLIILSHVLEHNHNPEQIINEVINYSDENTIIYIEVPDQRYVFLKGLIGKRFGMNFHVSFFSRTSLGNLLNKCGVNVQISMYDSSGSYRGDSLETIVAIGRITNNFKMNSKKTSLIYELFSTFLLIYFKIIRKFKQSLTGGKY